MEEHLGQECPQHHQQVHLELHKKLVIQAPVPKVHSASQSHIYYLETSSDSLH